LSSRSAVLTRGDRAAAGRRGFVAVGTVADAFARVHRNPDLFRNPGHTNRCPSEWEWRWTSVRHHRRTSEGLLVDPRGCKADGVTLTTMPGICASQDAANGQQLDVTVSAPVATFFMRLLGISPITATRASRALLSRDRPEAGTSAHGGDGASSGRSPGQATSRTCRGRSGSRHAEGEAFGSRQRSERRARCQRDTPGSRLPRPAPRSV
jgi:hypothetical protein